MLSKVQISRCCCTSHSAAALCRSPSILPSGPPCFIHLDVSHGAGGGMRFDQGLRRHWAAASVIGLAHSRIQTKPMVELDREFFFLFLQLIAGIMNLFCTADAIDSSNQSPMGSFCITARSPAAGRQKLDIGSGNRIGTIRRGKLKSRGVYSPIRQGCSRWRRDRWAKVKGAPTSRPCLVTHTSMLPVCKLTNQWFFFAEIILEPQLFKYCDCWEIPFVEVDLFCNRYIFRNCVSRTEWNLGCELLLFFCQKYTRIHIHSVTVTPINLQSSTQCDSVQLVHASGKPQQLYF